MVAGRVQHHLHHALDLVFRMAEATDVHAEATPDSRADLFQVEPLTLDVAGLVNVLGQGLEYRLLPEVVSQRLHPAHQASLSVADSSQVVRESVRPPAESGPSRMLMNK